MKHMVKLTAIALFAPFAANASTWSGTGGDWSSDGNPGWNGTGVPNARGAIAEFTTSGTVTIDIPAGVTLGSLMYSLPGTGDRGIIDPNNPIIMDNGAGMAVIKNETASRWMIYASQLPKGFDAVDDLLVVNSGAATGAYSIYLQTKIKTAGDLHIDNISANPNVAVIYFQGINEIAGDIHLLRGAIHIQMGNGNELGNANNTLYVGSAGNGSAFVNYSAGGGVYSPVVVNGESGGELTVGSLHATANTWFHGTVALDGDLTVSNSNAAPGRMRFIGKISGSGALTLKGPGMTWLENNNDHTGGTVIEAGTTVAAHASAFGTGPLEIKDGAALQLDTGVTVDSLKINGKLQPKGVYGATGSGARYIDDERFSGTGVLAVLNGCPLPTLLLLK